MPSYVLNAVKSIKNYGFDVNGSTFDPALTQGYINSKPNLSIIGSCCFIDYTATTDISDLTYLIKLFKNTPAGTTFQFSNSSYYDDDYTYTVDPTGVFAFRSLTGNDKIIVGSIVSGFTYLSNYKFYKKINFINPPQYTTGYTGGATGSNYITNNLNENFYKSFINFGVIGSAFSKEEYLGLSGSTSNTGKIKINSVLRLKDNRELLYTDTTLQNENLTQNEITLIHYLRGNANPEIVSKSKQNVGCYVVYDSNGNQVQCFENQNQLQAFLRSQYESPSYSAQWIPCLFCSRLTNNGFDAASSDKSILYDAQIFVLVAEQTSSSIDNNGNITTNYNYFLRTNINGGSTVVSSSSLSFTISNGLKIDLSHPTLKGFSVNVYSDSKKSVPVTEHLYLLGVPGFDQSGLLYSKTETSPRSLYIEFVGPTTLNLKIQIT